MGQPQRACAMHDRLDFRVGGCSISVRSLDAPLAEEVEPDYLPFLVRDGGEPPDLAIELSVGDPSLPPGARLLFEAGNCCTLHTCGDGLLVAPHVAPADTRPDWLALLGPDRRRVRIVCGDSLVAGAGAQRALASPFHYPLDQIVLSLALAGESLLVHAAGVEIGAAGLLLAGASGAGKTTISRLCAEGAHAVLSDDRVFIRRTSEGWRMFGTPWPGEGRFAANRGVPLAGIVFLRKGDGNRVRPLAAADLVRRLLPLASIPWYETAAAGRCLDLVADLAAGARVGELTFRPERDAVRALEEIVG